MEEGCKQYGTYLSNIMLQEPSTPKLHISLPRNLVALYYFQVRSLAAESDRAYQGAPLERSFYQEASLTSEEGGANIDASAFHSPNQYTRRLDWFAVDLEGEHSAMDGQILEEHAEYVVYAIHRVHLTFFFELFSKNRICTYGGLSTE